MHVSTASWQKAIEQAEGLVESSERKLRRQKNVHTHRLAKLEVLLFACLLILSFCLLSHLRLVFVCNIEGRK